MQRGLKITYIKFTVTAEASWKESFPPSWNFHGIAFAFYNKDTHSSRRRDGSSSTSLFVDLAVFAKVMHTFG